MTIRPEQPSIPEQDVQKPLRYGRRCTYTGLSARCGHLGDKPVDNLGSDAISTFGERPTNGYLALALASRILSSWGDVARVVALVGALLAVLVTGIGLLRLNVDLGPVHITRPSLTSAP